MLQRAVGACSRSEQLRENVRELGEAPDEELGIVASFHVVLAQDLDATDIGVGERFAVLHRVVVDQHDGCAAAQLLGDEPCLAARVVRHHDGAHLASGERDRAELPRLEGSLTKGGDAEALHDLAAGEHVHARGDVFVEGMSGGDPLVEDLYGCVQRLECLARRVQFPQVEFGRVDLALGGPESGTSFANRLDIGAEDLAPGFAHGVPAFEDIHEGEVQVKGQGKSAHSLISFVGSLGELVGEVNKKTHQGVGGLEGRAIDGRGPCRCWAFFCCLPHQALALHAQDALAEVGVV